MLVKFGVDINQADSSGTTALSNASQIGKTDIVKILLKYKVDTTITDKYNMTALMHAKKRGNTCIAEMIEQYDKSTSFEIVENTMYTDKEKKVLELQNEINKLQEQCNLLKE